MTIFDAIETRVARFLKSDTALAHTPPFSQRVHIVGSGPAAAISSLERYAEGAKVYESYNWVRTAITRMSNALAPLKVEVTSKQKRLPNHPMSELLAHVNDNSESSALWGQWITEMMLYGESFFEFVPNGRNKPCEIWIREPNSILIRPDTSRPLYPAVASYLFQPSSYLGGGNELEIEADWMLQDKFYNPGLPWRGLSVISAIRSAIIIDLFAQSWAKTFLQRGARPDYAVIAPEGLTTSERDDLEERLQAKFGGQNNWHRPIILEQGVTDIKTLSFPPKDLEWLAQRENSRQEVAAIFGVPDEVMGYGRNTYENIDAAPKWFWKLTLLPLAHHRDIWLTSQFRQRGWIKTNEKIQTDISEVGVLQEDLAPKLAQAQVLFSMGVPFERINEYLSLGLDGVEVAPQGTVERVQRTQVKMLVYNSQEHLNIWHKHVKMLESHENEFLTLLQEAFRKQKEAILERLLKDDAFNSIDWDEEIEYFIALLGPIVSSAMERAGQEQLSKLEVGLVFNLRTPEVSHSINFITYRFAKDTNSTNKKRTDQAVREVLRDADKGAWGIPQIRKALAARIGSLYDKSDLTRIARTTLGEVVNAGYFQGMRQSGGRLKKAWLGSLDKRIRPTHMEAHAKYQAAPILLNERFLVGMDSMLYPNGGQLASENIHCRCTFIGIPIV